MIVLLSLLFLLLGAGLLGSFSYLGLLGEHPLQALAPNIVTDCFSIAVTLILVEIVIRRHKASKGVEQVGPILLKTLNPAIDFTIDIFKSLHYTPAEFKAIHSAYVDGQLNPIHLPEDFKKRVVASLQAYDINKLEKAAKSVEQTKQFVGQFASTLEPMHILLVEVAHQKWQELYEVLKSTPVDTDAIPEAYMDAHDSFNDIANLFQFKATFKNFLRAKANV